MAIHQADSLGLRGVDQTYINAKSFFSRFAIFFSGIALLTLLSSYGYWWLQTVRGPSVIYFNIAFICAVFSGRSAALLLIFCLPLLPTLHSQLAMVTHPAVTYFIAYPGIDVIAGFCVGVYSRHVYQTRTWMLKRPSVPWPFGLLLFVLTISTALAVSRNLWQSATPFSLHDLGYNVLRFKVMNQLNDYAPVADLIVYSFAVLLAIVILNIIKNNKGKDAFVFEPVIYALMISACWGIVQSFSSFGLSDFTKGYRVEDLGFGAEGFQPDIHAFAGHMLIGAVGLLGYIVYIAYGRMRYLATTASVLCWIALVVSKSRASLVFAILLAILFGLFVLNNRRTKSPRSLSGTILALAIVTVAAFITSYFFWLRDFFAELTNTDISNFETINILLRWRLEFHRAALLMFEAFPWMGVGQGNFFRLSTILELTQSPWLAERTGNYAHNYFLQTLAETGIIGFGSFLLLFVWPFFNIQNRNKLIPVSMLILSVFLGNIYSHSLLIRENLFLLSVFIALMYAYVFEPLPGHFTNASRAVKRNVLTQGIAILVIVLVFYFAASEVAASFYKMPFQYAGHCYQGAEESIKCVVKVK